jgi:hypothetical protein
MTEVFGCNEIEALLKFSDKFHTLHYNTVYP